MSYTYTTDSVNIVATSLGSVLPALGAYLSLPGVASNYASTPDSPANSVIGDIDIRVKVALTDWTPAAVNTLVAKWTTAPNLAFSFQVAATGALTFTTSADGTANTTATSSAVVSAANGSVKWVRVTRVSTTGVCQFFTSDDGSDWTQLGTNQSNTAGAIANTNAIVEVGTRVTGSALPLTGAVYFAEVRDGIAGTVVAQLDLSGQPSSSTSVPNVAGQTAWTVNQSGGTPAYIVEEMSGYGRGATFNGKGLLCLNTATPAGSTIRSGWAMSPSLQMCITKAAISGADLVRVRSRAFTLDGRAYCSTPALAVAVARYVDRLPYTADGALKVNEK